MAYIVMANIVMAWLYPSPVPHHATNPQSLPISTTDTYVPWHTEWLVAALCTAVLRSPPAAGLGVGVSGFRSHSPSKKWATFTKLRLLLSTSYFCKTTFCKTTFL